MKLFLVGLMLVALTWAKADQYTDKWDNINVNEILESKRLLRGYVDCLLDKARCTPDGKSLKDSLPEALEHNCEKCTTVQKDKSEIVIRHLVNKRPDLWKELAGKYDPNDEYQARYKDRIDNLKSK